MVQRKTEPAQKPTPTQKRSKNVVPGADLLDQRALNRALLERQHLLQRVKKSVPAMLEHLVGMQAQVPVTPYQGLWSRLEGFDPEQLSGLLLKRKCVRAATLRGTLHLMTARDSLRVRPLMQPVFERALYSSSPYGKRLGGLALEELLPVGRAMFEERPRTLAELRKDLAKHWPKHDLEALSYAVHYSLPLVQIPPRGLWGQGGQPVCTTLEHWLGESLDDQGSVEKLVLRYLAAFGPASVKDAQTWSGLGKLGEVFEGLRKKLQVFRSEAGRELFDLPGAPRPSSDVEAPPRFLPEYENALLGFADRSRFGDGTERSGLPSTNESFGTFLIDGVVAGIWKFKKEGREGTHLRIKPFKRLAAQDKRALLEEGARFFTFSWPDEKADLRVVEQL